MATNYRFDIAKEEEGKRERMVERWRTEVMEGN